MAEKRDFEAIREIRDRLSTANDEALVKLSSKALAHVKNILKQKKASDHTTAFHAILQKHEKLDGAVERMNESLQFLNESDDTLKQDWEAQVEGDAAQLRGALFELLGGCEALDGEDIAVRLSSESNKLNKIMKRLRKIKSSEPKSCASFAKLSNEFEQSLKNLDNILGSTTIPADESDIYSKFSSDLEDLTEQIKRLNESLKFFQDEYTRHDWEYFMEQDTGKLKDSIETAYNSCEKFISVSRIA